MILAKNVHFLSSILTDLFLMIWIFFLVFGQNSTKQALVLGLGPTPIRRWRNVTYLHYFCNHFKYSRLVLHECNRKSSNTVVFKKERNGNLQTFLCTTLNLFLRRASCKARLLVITFFVCWKYLCLHLVLFFCFFHPFHTCWALLSILMLF